MSTNKTENYQLHAWELGDDFLLSEINANFGAIDAVLAGMPENRKLRIVTGTYIGDGQSSREINMGFRPKAVLVMMRPNGSYSTSLLFMDGASDEGEFGGGYITDQGLYLCMANMSPKDYGYARVNPYRYIALWWED